MALHKPFWVSDLHAVCVNVCKACGRAAKSVCNYRLSCENAVINKQTCLKKLQSSVSEVFWRFIAFVSFFVCTCVHMKVNERAYHLEVLKFTGQATLFLPCPPFFSPFSPSPPL